MKRVVLASVLSLAIVAFGFTLLRGTNSPIVVSPTEISFEPQQVGQSGRAVVVVSNVSDEAVVIDRVEVAAPFLSGKAFSLEPGESKAVLVRFQPEASGHFEAPLVIASQAAGAEHRVQLTASSLTPPVIALEQPFLSFGEVALGSSLTAAVTLANHGESPLRIESIGSNGGFRAEESQIEIPAGESRLLPLTFEPHRLATHNASIAIRSNDPVRQLTMLYLDGTGVEHAPSARLAVQPDHLDFGAVPVGGTVKRRVRITNEGSDPLSVARLEAGSPFNAPARSRSIAPGQTLTLPVIFQPSSDGGASHQLAIYSNDPEVPVAHVALFGRGDSRLAATGNDSSGAEGDTGTSRDGRDAARDEDGSSRVAGLPLGGGAAEGQDAAGAQDPSFLDDPASDRGDEAAEDYAKQDDPHSDPGDDPNQEPPAPQRDLAGEICFPGYCERVGTHHADSVDFDPSSGAFAINGFQPPTIDAALGEYFDFDPTVVIGRFDELGEAEVVVPVTVYDKLGNPTEIEVSMTTNTSEAVVDGRRVARSGAPLGTSNEARFVGNVRMPSNHPFSNEIMWWSFDVQL